MAQALRFVCSECQHAIEAWSDGNPYYLDKKGGKHYAYHPDYKNLDRCIGNDKPHLCLECGTECMVDSRDPISTCPTCGAAHLADSYHLKGRHCPYCKVGTFAVDLNFHLIS